jgi:hypothetical protein
MSVLKIASPIIKVEHCPPLAETFLSDGVLRSQSPFMSSDHP